MAMITDGVINTLDFMTTIVLLNHSWVTIYYKKLCSCTITALVVETDAFTLNCYQSILIGCGLKSHVIDNNVE